MRHRGNTGAACSPELQPLLRAEVCFGGEQVSSSAHLSALLRQKKKKKSALGGPRGYLHVTKGMLCLMWGQVEDKIKVITLLKRA